MTPKIIQYAAIIAVSMLLAVCTGSIIPNGKMIRLPISNTPTWRSHTHLISPAIIIRGGDSLSSTDSDSEDGGDSSSPDMPKKLVGLLGKVAVGTFKAFFRGVKAAFTAEDDPTEEPKSLTTRLFRTVSRVFNAVLSPTSAEKGEESDPSAGNELNTQESNSSRSLDFGSYLSSSYKVKSGRENVENVPGVLGGSLMDALSTARSQARLLLVLIPAARPGKLPSDSAAIKSFLSEEVARVAERKARKSSSDSSGSFLLWAAKPGSSEAVLAAKRLKTQSTGTNGKKRPILAAVYLAQAVDKHGVPRLLPRLLAQHHCSPPPDSTTMASWLNALRKRHAKQYITMETDAKERDLYRERKEGYKDSVQSDKQRKEREAKEEADRLANEAAEKERQEMLKKRRKDLLESLPEEPDDTVTDAKTVALRFADGRMGKRLFHADAPLQLLFDWVDAEFEMEREIITLTTMNGQKSFTWEQRDGSLAENGLPKMMGLRVSIATPEEPSKDADDDEDE